MENNLITNCKAREIKDSRGKATIEVELWSDEIKVVASVPSGRSAGSKEAVEKRDADGSVTEAVLNVNGIIAPEIVDKEIDPLEIDKILLKLDGTPNKSNLGANAILAVSIAVVKLGAKVRNLPVWFYIRNLLEEVSVDVAVETDKNIKFPLLYMNMMNGGVHANFNLPFQEYIVACGGDTLKESFEKAEKIRKELGKILEEKYGNVSLGDEGGYAPVIKDIEEPFRILSSLIKDEEDCFLAIDAAASEFYVASATSSAQGYGESRKGSGEPKKDGQYEISGKKYSGSELLDLYKSLIEKFGLASIEDPFAEDDAGWFREITQAVGRNILIVGDDLTVTNPAIIDECIEKKRENSVIIKPNQIGTIFETLETVRIAQEAKWKIIVSHRSGETMDSFIADLAVGVGAYGIKAGSPVQKERMVKYERLLEIENEMKDNKISV